MTSSPSSCSICDVRHISKPSEVWCPEWIFPVKSGLILVQLLSRIIYECLRRTTDTKWLQMLTLLPCELKSIKRWIYQIHLIYNKLWCLNICKGYLYKWWTFVNNLVYVYKYIFVIIYKRKVNIFSHKFVTSILCKQTLKLID
jgi:hypothetical protein